MVGAGGRVLICVLSDFRWYGHLGFYGACLRDIISVVQIGLGCYHRSDFTLATVCLLLQVVEANYAFSSRSLMEVLRYP